MLRSTIYHAQHRRTKMFVGINAKHQWCWVPEKAKAYEFSTDVMARKIVRRMTNDYWVIPRLEAKVAA